MTEPSAEVRERAREIEVALALAWLRSEPWKESQVAALPAWLAAAVRKVAIQLYDGRCRRCGAKER